MPPAHTMELESCETIFIAIVRPRNHLCRREIVPLVQPVDGIVFLTSMGEPFTPNHLAGESGWHGTSLSSWR